MLLNVGIMQYINCWYGRKRHLLHCQSRLQYVLIDKLDFPRAAQHSYFSGVLPRQHVLSLCPATVNRGMCNMGKLFSVLLRALAVSVLTVWTQDRTLWKHSSAVWAEAVSRLCHMVSKPFYGSYRKKKSVTALKQMCEAGSDWVVVCAELHVSACVCVCE